MMVHAEHKDTADYNYVTTSTGINLLYDSAGPVASKFFLGGGQ